MKILLLNQFFWPDNSATSQLLTDLARGLASAGHEVTAICSDKGYIATANAVASPDTPAAKIHRVKALRFVRGNLGRVLSYLSFYLCAITRSLTLPRQDVVLTLTTPPLLPLLGTVVKRFRDTRHFIWEMDMYPDVAVDLGYFKQGRVLDRLVGMVADFTRRNADGIVALGECMADRLIARGVPADKVWIAHNWADGAAITPQPRPGDPSKLVLLYSGNIGLAHDFDTILSSITQLSADTRFSFIFRGSGARRNQIADFIEQTKIQSIQLESFVPRASLSDSLAAGDIGLVTQREVCCGSVVPSKIYGLLAAGRPVLFIGPSKATPARLIRQFNCGWHIEPGDVAGLTSLLQHLSTHRDEVTNAGLAARQSLLAYFDVAHGVDRIISILQDESNVHNAPSFALPIRSINLPSVS